MLIAECPLYIYPEKSYNKNMMRITNDYFSIPQICESGQCFRLQQTGEDQYEVYARDKFAALRVCGEGTEIRCAEEDEDFWMDYFDLRTDYSEYFERIAPDDAYLVAASRYGQGIRILRQDVWEMAITFILSQQNNIPRIRRLVSTLCREYGKKRHRPDGSLYDAFPTPEDLSCATEEELRALKLGYRSKYICGTVRKVLEQEVDLRALADMSDADARSELMKLPGIGGKVADCICLFALHRMDAFPVDTHIRKALEQHYPDGFPFERYQGCAGLMQQYLFYYDLNAG